MYWLDLLKDTGYFDDRAHASLHADVDEMGAILFAILKTTRIRKKMGKEQ